MQTTWKRRETQIFSLASPPSCVISQGFSSSEAIMWVVRFDKDIRQRGTLLMIYPATNSQATRKEWDHVMEWGGRTKPFWGLSVSVCTEPSGTVLCWSPCWKSTPLERAESVDLSGNRIERCLQTAIYRNLCAIAQKGHNEHGGGTLEPLTASAAHSKMAASVAFIFCWSTLKFHCLP